MQSKRDILLTTKPGIKWLKKEKGTGFRLFWSVLSTKIVVNRELPGILQPRTGKILLTVLK